MSKEILHSIIINEIEDLNNKENSLNLIDLEIKNKITDLLLKIETKYAFQMNHLNDSFINDLIKNPPASENQISTYNLQGFVNSKNKLEFPLNKNPGVPPDIIKQVEKQATDLHQKNIGNQKIYSNSKLPEGFVPLEAVNKSELLNDPIINLTYEISKFIHNSLDFKPYSAIITSTIDILIEDTDIKDSIKNSRVITTKIK